MSSPFPENHIPNFKQQNANYIVLGGGVCFPFMKNYGNHVRKTMGITSEKLWESRPKNFLKSYFAFLPR